MARLNQKSTTLLSVLAAALVSAAAIGAIFGPSIKKLEADVAHTARVLSEDRVFLAQKPALQSEWESKKGFFDLTLLPDAALNGWVNDLLSLAQAQSLTLEKLEPAGIKTDSNGKSLAVFISFQGNIRQIAGFMHRIAQNDPLSRVGSFLMRQEENSAILSIEMMLQKPVK